uniref:Dystonin isoform X1 n=1 Tax=Saccoglossus kowalevskii TaxID=10224 RepID=A0ABM0LZ95_SACKO|nr:PREDICTED: dystonin isoform X1 [Saccoglossus kowalevskii]
MPIQKDIDDLKPKVDEVQELCKALDALTKPDEEMKAVPERLRSRDIGPEKPSEKKHPAGRRLSDRVVPSDLLTGPSESQKKTNDVVGRYSTLADKLADRQNELAKTRDLMKGLTDKTDKLQPILEWVEEVKEQLRSQSPVSQDVSPVTAQLDDQKKLADDITDHKSPVAESTKSAEEFLKENKDKLKPEEIADLQKLIDDVKDGYDDVSDRSHDRLKQLQETLDRLQKEEAEKAALDEKFTEQNSTIQDMLQWVTETETKLGEQQPMKEIPKQLTEQLDKNKTIQDDVTDHQRPVIVTLQAAQTLLATEGSKLEEPQKNKLEECVSGLKTRYDVLIIQTETRVKRLKTSVEEVKKFEVESSTFTEWLTQCEKALDKLISDVGKDRDVLKDQNKELKTFTEEVIDHKADLKFINMSGHQFLETAKEFKKDLADFRNTSLPKQQAKDFVETPETSITKNRLTDMNDRYNKLKAKGTQHTETLKDLLDKHQKYQGTLDDLLPWLEKTDAEMTKLMKESIGAEPDLVQSQIDKLKALQDDINSHNRDVEKLKSNGKEIIETQPEMKEEVEKMLDEVSDKYSKLETQAKDRNNALQTALTQSQSVQDGLDALLNWLDEFEPKVDNLEFHTPMIVQKEELRNIMQKQKLLYSELGSHKPSIETVNMSATKLITVSDTSVAHAVQEKLDDLHSRFGKASDTVSECGEYFQSLHDRLNDFLDEVDNLEDWLIPTLETLDSHEMDKMELLQLGTQLLEVASETEDYKPTFSHIKELSRELITDPQAADTSKVSEVVENVNKNWQALQDGINKRNKQLDERQKAHEKFIAAIREASDFLDAVEDRVGDLEPVAKDIKTLKSQLEEQQPIKNELEDLRPDIENVTELGLELEALNAVVPVVLTPAEKEAAKPKRSSEIVSPEDEEVAKKPEERKRIRRMSDQGVPSDFLQEPSDVTKQVTAVNDRFDKLIKALDDRQKELEGSLGLVSELNDKTGAVQGLLDWVIDMGERLESQEPIASELEPVTEQLNEHKPLVDDTAEHKQPITDALKAAEQFLTDNQDKLTADQKEDLQKKINDLRNGFDDVSSKAKERLKDLQSTLAQLEKEKAEKDAVQKKYAEDAAAIHDLLEWIVATEKRLGFQQPLLEEITPLSDQLKENKNVYDDVNTHQQPIQQAVRNAEKLIDTKGKKIPEDDKSRLQVNINELTTRYEVLTTQSTMRVKKLNTAVDELEKFTDEVVPFEEWLAATEDALIKFSTNIPKESDKLKDQRENLVDVEEDIISHKAELRFVNMSGQKFMENSKEYKSELSEFRTNKIPKSFTKNFTEAPETSLLKNRVNDINERYKKLKTNCKDLVSKLKAIDNKGKKYQEALDNVLPWLQQTEEELKKVLEEPVGAEPKVVQKQVDKVKAMLSDLATHGKDVEKVKDTGKDLIESQPERKDEVQNTTDDTEEKYKDLIAMATDRSNTLQTALTQSQGVQDGIEALLTWLDDTEKKLDKITESPIDAKKDSLVDKQSEIKVLQSDLDSHKPSVDAINKSASELIKDSEPSVARVVKDKLDDLNKRFGDVSDKTKDHGNYLQGVQEKLDHFLEKVDELEDFVLPTLETLESKDLATMELLALGSKLLEISANLDENRPKYTDIQKLGEELVKDPKLSDTSQVKDVLDNLNKNWSSLEDLLDKRNKQLNDKQAAYEKYNDATKAVLDWLDGMEKKVEELKPVAVDVELLKQELEGLKPISDDHGKYHPTIEEVNDLGNAINKLNQEDDAPSPTASPRKRSRAAILAAQQGSPEKKLGRRASDQLDSAPFATEETSEVQKQLNQINDRYDDLGEKLKDRQQELDSNFKKSDHLKEEMKELMGWMDKMEADIDSQEPVAASADDVKKQLKQQKALQKDLDAKSGKVDDMKALGEDLLKDKENAPGAEEIKKDLKELDDKYKELQKKAADRQQELDDASGNLGDFEEACKRLKKWLGHKEKIIGVLGSLAAEVMILRSQKQQIEVLLDEFDSNDYQLEDVNKAGQPILDKLSPEELESSPVKAQLDELNNKWNDLKTSMQERCKKIEETLIESEKFHDALREMLDWLSDINGRFKNLSPVSTNPAIVDRQIQETKDLQEEVDSKKPSIVLMHEKYNILMDLVDEPTAKADLKRKLDAVVKPYDELCQKLDERLGKLQAALLQSKDFEDSFADILKWLDGKGNELVSAEPVHALPDKVKEQVKQHEPVVKDIKQQEPSYEQVATKAQKMLLEAQPGPEYDSLKDKVDDLKSKWDDVNTKSKDRQDKLKDVDSCADKYNNEMKKMLPWLQEAEEKLSTQAPVSLELDEAKKQKDDAKALNDDVAAHKAILDKLNQVADKLVDASETGGDEIKDAVKEINDRFDTLNKGAAERKDEIDSHLKALQEFNDAVKNASDALGKCEGILADHDKLGDEKKDSKHLDKIKDLLAEVNKIKPKVDKVKELGDNVIDKAPEEVDTTPIQEEVDFIAGRLDLLKTAVAERLKDLETASEEVDLFQNKLRDLQSDMSDLEERYDQCKHVARDEDTLRKQIDEVKELQDSLRKRKKDIDKEEITLQDLITKGFTAEPEKLKEQKIADMRKQIATLKRRWNRLNDRTNSRSDELDMTLERVRDFYQKLDEVCDALDAAEDSMRSYRPVGADVDTIKLQQADFKKFHKEHIDRLSGNVGDTNKAGQGLVQSASTGVDTSKIEKDIEEMNERWNKLSVEVSERDNKLSDSLLQCGKFSEALQSLLDWLEDTEEHLASQKDPSADYKVVKAQLDGQKLLDKLIAAKKNSVDSVKDMGEKVMASMDTDEKETIREQLDDLQTRWDALNDLADKRRKNLEELMDVAKAFQDKMDPLTEWIEKTEKTLSSHDPVGSTPEKIEEQIQDHKALADEVANQKEPLDQSISIGQSLRDLVCDEDREILQVKMDRTQIRYDEIAERCARREKMLAQALKNVERFGANEQDLIQWLVETNQRLDAMEPISSIYETIEQQLGDHTNLNDDVVNHKSDVDAAIEAGHELIKHCTGSEVLAVEQKLDSIKDQYTDICVKSDDRMQELQQAKTYSSRFHEAHRILVEWLDKVEDDVNKFDTTIPAEEQKIKHEKLQALAGEHKQYIDTINEVGPKLMDLVDAKESESLKEKITLDNKRYNGINQKLKEIEYKLMATLEGAQKITASLDEMVVWLEDLERMLKILCKEPIDVEPDGTKKQLKTMKSADRDVHSKGDKMKDYLSAAERLMEETSDEESKTKLKDKVDMMKSKYDELKLISGDKLDQIEDAVPLALQFKETHEELTDWLDMMEKELKNLVPPGLEAEEIRKEVDKNRLLKQEIAEKKQFIQKLNKTAPKLMELSPGEGADSVKERTDDDNARYEKIKEKVQKRAERLTDALQRTTSYHEDLDNMLEQLGKIANHLINADPVAADPEVLKKQIKKLQNLRNDVEGLVDSVEGMKTAGEDMMAGVENLEDPTVKELKDKLEQLKDTWDTIIDKANDRGSALDDCLDASERFWDELQGVSNTVKETQDTLKSQEPPGVQTDVIKEQQEVLQAIKEEIEGTQDDVENVRQTGEDLMRLCGEPDRPEVKKNIDELDKEWDTLNAMYEDREEALTDAFDAASKYHDALHALLEYITDAEQKFDTFAPVATEPVTIKEQLEELKEFKGELDPHQVDVEAINQQGNQLMSKLPDDCKHIIRGPLVDLNRRWDGLQVKTVDRKHKLEAAMLALGQLEGTLDELLNWLKATEKALDEAKHVYGDRKLIEVELAKHKVLQNDILAHQASVRQVNTAGKNFIGTEDADQAGAMKSKLDDLNERWEDVMKRSDDRQRELEDALDEAYSWQEGVLTMLKWMQKVTHDLETTKPTGGLPETAKEQLDQHVNLQKDIARKEPDVDFLIKKGHQLLEKSDPESRTSVEHTLHNLESKWQGIQDKSLERKQKLEIALKQAQEFHDSLQSFISWLTTVEKTLNNSKAPSTILENVNKQIKEHEDFTYQVKDKHEAIKELDRVGTQLKYFSQKQDVILIKNLLVSVQHRWEKALSRCADTRRQLEVGMKRAKQFDDQYRRLYGWLEDSEKMLIANKSVGSDPKVLKQQLAQHREFQRTLGAKQPVYDNIVRTGRTLREKSNPLDTKIMNGMLRDLKDKWDLICGKSVDRQHKLEEALLYSGQFKDALQALLDWLYRVEPTLTEESPVHGDIDTVLNLTDAHKQFQRDLGSRKTSVKSVNKSAKELMETSSDDTTQLKAKLNELQQKWERVCGLSVTKLDRLGDAMKEAEAFHQAVHSLLEWLADAEQSLRFHGPLPEDEEILTEQIENHKDFKKLMAAEESRLKDTIAMGMAILKKCHPDAETVIKHWITVLEARWAEVQNWSDQREQRLLDALQQLKTNAELLEALMAWLEGAEATLKTLEEEPIPEELEVVEKLLEEHREFQGEMSTKQPDVDRVIKPHKRRRSISDGSHTGIPVLDRSRRGRHRHRRPASREPSPGPDASRNPRAAALFNKWKHVWVMSLDRQRKLQDVYDRLAEMRIMKNFNFNDWRRRYMRWMNHKKSRVMDFFRRIDLDHDGKVTRREFIEGVLSSKFPTTRLEMNAVADIFDRDGDGYIDYKEFIAALKPDSERAKPITDQDKIQDEVRRQVSLCTCTKQFQVMQIGEGKYRFGDSQRLRLVRILRSTVMVRVGGGWMALDEFLVKNDPCRERKYNVAEVRKRILQEARGRTNIELRERFILAEGVSQSMQAFRTRSPGVSTSGSSTTGSSRSMSGPIMKIREKKNITRPWQRQSPMSVPSVVSSTSSDGVKTTRERRPDGTVITKTHHTKECPAGPHSHDHGNVHGHSHGPDVSCKVGGQHVRTTADVKTKTVGGMTRGEVTFRTETLQTRTITLPTVARTTYTRVPRKASPTKTTQATPTTPSSKVTSPTRIPSPTKKTLTAKPPTRSTSRDSLSSDKDGSTRGLSVFDRLSTPRKTPSRASSRESLSSDKDGSIKKPIRKTPISAFGRSASRESLSSEKDTALKRPSPLRRTTPTSTVRKTPSRSASRESLGSEKDAPSATRRTPLTRKTPSRTSSRDSLASDKDTPVKSTTTAAKRLTTPGSRIPTTPSRVPARSSTATKTPTTKTAPKKEMGKPKPKPKAVETDKTESDKPPQTENGTGLQQNGDKSPGQIPSPDKVNGGDQ